MATIKDIAKKMGIGVSTVSMALNNNPRISQDTRTEVLKIAKELGYVKNGLAADLQKGRSNLILLVLEDASRPFFSSVISQVQKEVAKHNFDLLISTTFENHSSTAKKYISEHRCAGAIIFTMNIDDDFIATYASKDFPVFVLGRPVEGKHMYSSPASSFEAPTGYVATQYLIDYGHQNIAFVKGSFNTLGTIRRFEGYLNALHDYAIEYDENIIYEAKDSEHKSGYEITKEIINDIKKYEIDAILYSNNDLAIGGLHCLIEHGIKVPDDISIIGYNSLPYTKYLTPALTTVDGTAASFECAYAVDFLVAKILDKDIQEVEAMYADKFLHAGEEVVERDTVKRKQ